MSDLNLALNIPELQNLFRTLEKKLHCPIPIPADPAARVRFFQEYVDACALVFLDGPGFISPRNPDHIYQPVLDALRSCEAESNTFVGLLREFYFHNFLERIPLEEQDETTPFWNNSWFTGADARCLYSVIAHARPKRIVEIGSGNSTRFIRRALTDFEIKSHLTCIDPRPRTSIRNIADTIKECSLLDVSDEIFQELRPGDVLFLDGSHLVFNGTDCTRFFLEILPALPPGILVHVHDILLPYEYDTAFSKLYFAEQYLLAALLISSQQWVSLWGTYYFRRMGMHPEFVPEGPQGSGQSFWMIRK